LVDLDATEQRTRKLPAALTTLLCVAMSLFTDTALEPSHHTLLSEVRDEHD